MEDGKDRKDGDEVCEQAPTRAVDTCTCGIAIAEARRFCTEIDCPYK